MTNPSATPLRHGASIAVFKEDAVLLVKRARAPWRGLWSLPGGNIEKDELPLEAALRELKEEAGITAAIAGLLDTIELAALDDDGARVEYRLEMFYGRYAEGSLQAGSDAAEAQWFPLSALEKLSLTKGTAALIRLAAERLGVARA
jgi:ADP-ribose pyrophosphatase YjhB (NUDIX family)